MLSGRDLNSSGGANSTMNLLSMNSIWCAAVRENSISLVTQIHCQAGSLRDRYIFQAPVSQDTDRMLYGTPGAMLYLLAATGSARGYVFVGRGLTDVRQQREFSHFHRNLVVFSLIAE